MLRIFVTILLLLGAQCSLTAFAPAPAGKAWVLWPFSALSRPRLGFVGGLPRESGSVVTPLLAGVAGLTFLAAVCALWGLLVPLAWWPWLAAAGGVASVLLFLLYFNRWAFLPLAASLAILFGLTVGQWGSRITTGW